MGGESRGIIIKKILKLPNKVMHPLIFVRMNGDCSMVATGREIVRKKRE